MVLKQNLGSLLGCARRSLQADLHGCRDSIISTRRFSGPFHHHHQLSGPSYHIILRARKHQISYPAPSHTKAMSGNNSTWSSSPASITEASASEASTTTASAGSADPRRPAPRFTVSPVPPNPLGEGRCIRTAAALIIGDEILNGKTMDSNSHVFAQFCFQHGIDLKRIEVVPDDEQEIIEAARRLSTRFDFVVTSGGIGPTHDDITYASLAKAFNTPLVHNEETIRRMKIMNMHRKWATLQTPEQKAATLRMALFPQSAEVLFVHPELWVPVVRLGGKLCVFPGIPGLFQKMLHALADFIPLPSQAEIPHRIQVFTERAESLIAPYLTQLQERLRPHSIQVGSYPILYKGVFVSLIGRDKSQGQEGTIQLAEIAREVEREVGGRILSEEEVVEHKKAAKKFKEEQAEEKKAESEARKVGENAGVKL